MRHAAIAVGIGLAIGLAACTVPLPGGPSSGFHPSLDEPTGGAGGSGSSSGGRDSDCGAGADAACSDGGSE